MAYYGQQQQPGYQPQGGNPYAQQQGPPVYGTTPGFAEGGGVPKANLGFNDQTIRAAFVRKVFFLVSIMLGVVSIMCAIPFLHPPMMQFVRANFWLYLISLIAFFGVYIALICSDSLRRSYPGNMICLGILTLAIGFMTMMLTAYHTIESVFLCFVITAVSCAAVSLFATVTKKDLTSCMGFMFIATMCLLLFGIIIMFLNIFQLNMQVVRVIYAALGAFLFMGWLAIDIQMIMGGKTHEITPEEHIFASLMIFLDIIQIFWFILTIFGDRN